MFSLQMEVVHVLHAELDETRVDETETSVWSKFFSLSPYLKTKTLPRLLYLPVFQDREVEIYKKKRKDLR